MLVPPSSLFLPCKPTRVVNSEVASLIEANIKNTTEVYKCNNKLQALKAWYEQQSAVGKGEPKP